MNVAHLHKTAVKNQLVLLALVTIMALLPQTALALSNDKLVVSLGDSYSSGEGCPPFYGQNSFDKYSEEDWVAHRSEHSWPGQLRIGGTQLSSVKRSQLHLPFRGIGEESHDTSGDVRWYFYACSGAEAHHVNADDYTKKGVRLDTRNKFETQVRQQLAEAKDDIGNQSLSDVDYVTMTIGGNDIGFTDIVTQTAVRQGFIDRDYLFNALNVAWYNYNRTKPYNKVQENSIHFQEQNKNEGTPKRDEIRRCYQDVLDTFPSSDLIVAGYPPLMDGSEFQKVVDRGLEGFWNKLLFCLNIYNDNRQHMLGFSSWEGWFINRNIEQLNISLQELGRDVDTSRIHFVDVQKYFIGHESNVKKVEDRFINDIKPVQSEDFEQLSNYLRSPISSYSMHPNYKDSNESGRAEPHDGVSCYRIAVQNVLDQLEKEKASDEDEDPILPANVGTCSVSMVLDVSGSMSGEPMDQTKRAASSFVDKVAGSAANVGLVAFDDEAKTLADIDAGKNSLKIAINDLSEGGGTNIGAGLDAGFGMVRLSDATRKIVVLMSDGEPTDGKKGDELISYARSLRDPNGDGKDDIKVYALGFNESASGQRLLREIASEGCHYEAQDATQLQGFFTDIADEINGTRYIYARIACPVNVTVTKDGETLSSVGDSPQMRTSFGSLSFEEHDQTDGSKSNGSIKVLRLREGNDYDVSIEGYDEGTMDYRIGFLNEEGNYDDFRTFSNVEVHPTSRMTTTATVSDSTMLEIDDNGDGTIDRRFMARANGNGELVDNRHIVRLVLLGFAFVGLAIAVVYITRKLVKIQRKD